MKISVCHPSARPLVWRKRRSQWIERAKYPETVEYVLSFHREQADSFYGSLTDQADPWFKIVVNTGPNHPTLNGRSSYVGNLNLAAAHASGELIVTATDDVEPPDRWDIGLRSAIQSAGYETTRTLPGLVVEVSSGTPQDSQHLMLHPILTRARWKEQGWVVCPEYSGVYSDNDFTGMAHRDRVIVDGRYLRFQHLHPFFGTAKSDKAYEQQNSAEEYERGRQIFIRRRLKGFPKGDPLDSDREDFRAALENLTERE